MTGRWRSNCTPREAGIYSVRFQPRLIFLGVKIHSRHGLDPAKMVVNFPDTGNILRRDNRCPPGLFIGNHTAEMNIAVTHNDAEPERAPVSFLDKCDNMAANVIVIGRRIRDIRASSATA